MGICVIVVVLMVFNFNATYSGGDDEGDRGKKNVYVKDYLIG